MHRGQSLTLSDLFEQLEADCREKQHRYAVWCSQRQRHLALPSYRHARVLCLDHADADHAHDLVVGKMYVMKPKHSAHVQLGEGLALPCHDCVNA